MTPYIPAESDRNFHNIILWTVFCMKRISANELIHKELQYNFDPKIH